MQNDYEKTQKPQSKSSVTPVDPKSVRPKAKPKASRKKKVLEAEMRKTGGVLLQKPDIRQYSHARSFGSATSYPTAGLGRKPLAIYDQSDTELCTAASMAGAMSFKVGFPVSFEFMAALEGEVNGYPIVGGTTMDMAPKALATFGLINQKDCPYTLKIDGVTKIASWSNYPQELWSKAKQYLQGSYYTAHTGPYDPFTNIISAIYVAHQQGEEIAVQMGTQWYLDFNAAAESDSTMPTPKTPTAEHAWVIYDWSGDTAYALLSQGESWGGTPYPGVLRFPKEVVNFLFQDSYATTRVMRSRDITDGSLQGILLKYLYDSLFQLVGVYQKLIAQK